jgi:hypothetical protein
MSGMAEHAKPHARKDHLWVLFTIAACVLAEVWASWVGIGAISGFPRIDGIPTDWVLAMAMEAYWGYALYAWLVASPGPRSRAMAMWSCAVVFAMSLAGQVLYHELTVPPGTPPGRRVVIGFVTSLPVIVLALIAVLIHLRHADREDAAQAVRAKAEAERQAAIERAEADERAALRAELETLRQEFAAAETARGEAERRAEDADANTATLTRKLAAMSEAKGTRKPGARKPAASTRKSAGSPPETRLPDDFDAQTEALRILAAEPDISGAKLAERVGRSERWGQLFKSNLAKTAPQGIDSDGPE